MKIGIMTFHNAENYGAVLQAYALKNHLQKMNPSCQVDIVDYRCPLIEESHQYFRPISYFKHTGIRRIVSFLLQFLYFPKRVRVKGVFEAFVTDFLEPQNNSFNEYDYVVYGSDQIWNPSLTGNDTAYFGKGFSGKKIAYAASDGGELVSEKETISLLQDFHAISCREKSLSHKLHQHLPEKSVETVCDPVFLLSKEDWLSFAQPPKERNYLLVYKISENKEMDTEAESFAKKWGKQVIQIVYVKSVKKFLYFKQKFVWAITPNEFVGYFAHADFIFTTSFHGSAFSIILERDFYTFQFAHRNERITDLFCEMELSERFVSYIPCYETLGEHAIDWTKVTQKREEYRQRSVDFLNCSLEMEINNVIDEYLKPLQQGVVNV